MTSFDGITWTIRASAANSNWEAVEFGADLYVFVSYWGFGGRITTCVTPSFFLQPGIRAPALSMHACDGS